MRGHAGRDAERRGGARTGAGREKDETRARRKDVGAQARSTQGDTEDAAAWAQRDSRGGAADNQYHKNRPMRAKRPRVNYRLNPALPNNCKSEKLTNLNRKCIFKHPGSHSPQPGSGNALGTDLHTSGRFEMQSRWARGHYGGRPSASNPELPCAAPRPRTAIPKPRPHRAAYSRA